MVTALVGVFRLELGVFKLELGVCKLASNRVR